MRDEIGMTPSLTDLRQAKRLNAEELESLIRSLTPHFISKAEAVRRLFSPGTLMTLGNGEPYDTALIRSALIAVVLSDVYPLNPYARDEQVENISIACKHLGISYEEVLGMTTKERQIVAALQSSAS